MKKTKIKNETVTIIDNVANTSIYPTVVSVGDSYIGTFTIKHGYEMPESVVVTELFNDQELTSLFNTSWVLNE